MVNEVEKNAPQEVLSMELPAPSGWKKQFFPTRGGTSKKNAILFTSPTGEEIHNQRQLQQYLKSHPSGPPASEFDWSTGETPRRSARISEKVKTSPENEPPKKKSRRSSSATKKGNNDGETSAEETKKDDAQMEDAEKAVGDQTADGAEKAMEEKMADGAEMAGEEKTADEVEKDIEMHDTGKTENPGQDAGSEKEAAKEDQSGNEDTAVERKDIEMHDTGKTENPGQDAGSEKEAAKEDKPGNEDTAVERKEPELVSKDETTIPVPHDQKNADQKNDEGAGQIQPQDIAPITVESAQQQPGEETEKKDIPEQVTSETEGSKEVVAVNKPGDEKNTALEVPQSVVEKQISMQEPVKPDVAANTEAKLKVDSVTKDNGTDSVSMEELNEKEPEGVETTKKITEVNVNGSQAGKAAP